MNFRRFLFVCCLILIFISLSKTQNLVPNPGFEEVFDEPHYTPVAVGDSPGWISLGGSSDFFHRSFSRGASVPRNNRGYQEPAVGDGYAGIFVGPTYEFLSAQLIEPLEEDVLYDVSFMCNLSADVRFATDDIGAVFLPEKPHEDSLRTYSFNIKNLEGSVIKDTLLWTSVHGKYLARGGEKFILIGNLYPDHLTDFEGHIPEGIPLAYYFIDEVVVEKCSNPEVDPISYDTSGCEGQKLILSGFSDAKSHYWAGIGTNKDIEITKNGWYTVDNYYDCGVVQQRFLVTFDPCDCSLTIPAVYNHLNRIQIKPSRNVLTHELIIYDASGRIFLESNELELDGSLIPYPSALYFWSAQLSCQGLNENVFDKKISGKLMVQN